MSAARLIVWPRRVVYASSVFVCFAGLLVLIGWTFRIDAIKSVLPGLPNMAAGTALVFILLGIGLWCVAPMQASADLTGDPGVRTRLRIARLCAGTAIVIGSLRLISYLTGVDLRLDELWFSSFAHQSTVGRMSPATATDFVVLGLALYAAVIPRWSRTVQIFAISGGLLGWLGISRYLFGGQPILPYSQMAVHTAFSFIVLSLGLLCLCENDGLVALLISETPGGVIARRLVPSTLLVPYVLGWLVLKGEHAGWFQNEAGIALLALVNVVVFGGLIWANAFHLHNAETDRKRAWESLRFSEEALRSSEAKLQGIISSAMDAIISVDEQQRIVVFNRAAEKIFQCAASEAVGSDLNRFIPESLHAAHREHMRRFAAQGLTKRSMNLPAILTAIRTDGEEFPIEATISQVQADGEKLYTVILRDITERKRSEARLRRFYETELFAILYWSIDGGVIDVNDSFLKMTGYTREEVRAGHLNWAQMTPLEYQAVDEDARRQIRETGVHLPYEKEFIRKDGTRVWGLFSAAAWEDNRNEGITFILDVTARKRAEEEVEKAKRHAENTAVQLRSIVENMAERLYVCDSNGHQILANEAFRSVFPGTGTIEFPQSFTDVMEAFDMAGNPVAVTDWPIARALRGEKVRNFELRLRFKHSKEEIINSYNASPVLDAGGKVIMAVFTSQAITERKRAEEALRKSEERWATTLRSIGDAVISTDGAGMIVFMNDVAQKLTGWPLANAVGKHLNTVFNIVQEVTRIKPESPVSKVIRLGKVVGLANHTALIRRDGTEIPIEDSGAPIRNREGQIEGVVLVFHDVSEQRNIQKALRSSERLATTGRLASTIAHEIHNPLDAVGNLLYLIEKEACDKTIRGYVTLASRELERVTKMTRQMLTFQREAAKPVPVRIGEILNSVLELYERKLQSAGITVETPVDCKDEILAQPGELRQVFANLIGNAIEATRSTQGKIILRAYSSREWRNGVTGIRVIVADNGPGIPAGIRSKIYEPFFTTKGESGTGLGLWITADIIRKYNGTMRLWSSARPGRSGTCFSVFLPFETSAEEIASAGQVGSPAPG